MIQNINKKRKLLAFTISGFCLVTVFISLILLTDIPLKKQSFKEDIKIAALAIRDDVIPFQKYGSKLFTEPYLQKYYDDYSYFTQYYFDDKKEEIIKRLQFLLLENDSVDIFLLAHSNNFISYLDGIKPELRAKIRLVYNTGCGDADQYEYWSDSGIKAYVAHSAEKSVSPLFYFFFLRRWSKGYMLKDVVNESNIAAGKVLKNIFTKFDSNIKKKMDLFSAKAELYGNKNLKIR